MTKIMPRIEYIFQLAILNAFSCDASFRRRERTDILLFWLYTKPGGTVLIPAPHIRHI